MNIASALLTCLIALLPVAAGAEEVSFGLFGALHLTRPATNVERTVLLFSDRPGWTARQDRLSGEFAAHGALVVGIDLAAYLKRLEALPGDCSFPAGHVEELAHWIGRHEGLANYATPLLIGDGAGAAFAYAVAAQAPAGTFAGLMTVGWDDDLRLAKAVCPGDAGPMTTVVGKSGFRVVPVATLSTPWRPEPFAPGARDSGALARVAEGLRVVAAAWPVLAPRDPGRAYALWQQRAKAARVALPDDVADLPLTEVAPVGADSGRLAIMLSGDGGWAGLDKGVAAVLAAHGIRVVGLSTLKFFWHTRTPQEIIDAVARVIAHYDTDGAAPRVVLIGYSFGASLVPVVIDGLPAPMRQRVRMGVMISPDDVAVFQIKVGDWFGGAEHAGSVPIAPKIARSQIPLWCIYGGDESDSFCRMPQPVGVQVRSLPGGHHYEGNYDALGKLVMAALPHPD